MSIPDNFAFNLVHNFRIGILLGNFNHERDSGNILKVFNIENLLSLYCLIVTKTIIYMIILKNKTVHFHFFFYLVAIFICYQ